MSDQRNFSRRQMLKIFGLSIGSLALGACGAAAPTATPTSAPGTAARPFEGVTLRMLTQAGIAYEPALMSYARDFESRTGARVQFEFAPWETLMPKIQADLASGQPQFDMFANDIEFQYTIWPHLLPIQERLAARGIQTSQLFPFAQRYGEGIAGQTGVRYGMPLIVGVSVVFYRTDLIPKIPATWSEYEQALAANTGGGKYGLAFAGVPAQLVKLFLARYWSQGDPLLSTDWQPLINSEKGVRALTMLRDMVERYAPPGVLGWDNPDAANAFLNGDVAVLEGWGAFILDKISDPSQSRVVDKWAIGPYPEGGTGNVVQHNAVIFKHSQNQDAAFEFLTFITSNEAQKQGVLDFGMDPAIESLYNDPEVVAKRSYMPDYATVLKAGKPVFPSVPQWLEMFIGLAEGLSAALARQKEPQTALDEVAAKWRDLIAQNPLDFPYNE